ncbi:pyridoxal-phosphate dependent enzyme [Streptomyces sp. NPDC060333]|uniref:pyridoxal-phosphate dependent enzyme n=1 Tax=Streptomyces sp. NPDC060333 TaxID=3347098 RepID=UPI00365C0DD0
MGAEYAEALAARENFAGATGALASHAYDHPLIAAGAGTLLEEIRQQIPGLDTVVVAVGGGLFAGVATAAQHHGVRVVAVDPENCGALNAALEAGEPVDVPVDSIAADSLGARRTSRMALHAAQQDRVHSVLVQDRDIITARQALWDHRRVAVEHGAAAALEALLAEPRYDSRWNALPQPGDPFVSSRSYQPGNGERVAVILCGANTDPSSLTNQDDL